MPAKWCYGNRLMSADGKRRLTTGYDEAQWAWLGEEARRRGWKVGQLVRHLIDQARNGSGANEV